MLGELEAQLGRDTVALLVDDYAATSDQLQADILAARAADDLAAWTRAAHSLNAAQVTYLFSGHVHEPVLYYMGTDGKPQPFRPIKPTRSP